MLVRKYIRLDGDGWVYSFQYRRRQDASASQEQGILIDQIGTLE